MKTLKSRLVRWVGLVRCSVACVLDGRRSRAEAFGHLLTIPVLAPLSFVGVVVFGL